MEHSGVGKWRDLGLRMLSALILVPVVLAATWAGGVWFTLLVAVLGVAETKGLEFDGVIVVEPASIVRESDRGMSDLYVALTRATRRLGVVHSEALPREMEGLRRPPTTGDAVGARETPA